MLSHRPRLALLVGLLLAGTLASPLHAQQEQGSPPPVQSEEPGEIFDRGGLDMDEQMIARIKEQPLNWMFGVSLMVANPQDSLRSALQNVQQSDVGIGFGLNAGYYFDPVPVAITGEFAMNFYGGDSKRYVVNGPVFKDTLSYETLNLQMPVTFSARLQPNLFTWLYPYGEVIGGFMIFNSNLSITRTTGSSGGTTSVDTEGENETSASWLYGAGAGIMIKTADIITLPNSLQRVLIDVRFRYLRSTNVSIPSVELTDTEEFRITSVPVPDPSFVTFNIGITAQF